LDDAPADDLAGAPIHYADGLHDRTDQTPDDIRLL
jgi:hypothetical protein